jgi:signal transduction histidine kinase
LRGRSLPDERRDEFLAVMAEDLHRLQHTIDQIIQAARVHSPRARRHPVELAPMLRACADDARERHGLPPEAVLVSVPASARVRGDEEQLGVAFRNLLDNAVRYAGGEVHVEVHVRPVSARRLEIEFADRGVGIPASALDRVFQRFQRLPQEAVRAAHGLGLGLAIVRNIARAHGGSARAESDGEGKGSRFILTLPGHVGEGTNPPG